MLFKVVVHRKHCVRNDLGQVAGKGRKRHTLHWFVEKANFHNRNVYSKTDPCLFLRIFLSHQNQGHPRLRTPHF